MHTVNDFLTLLPIAVLNAWGHASTVNAMFQKGGGRCSHLHHMRINEIELNPERWYIACTYRQLYSRHQGGRAGGVCAAVPGSARRGAQAAHRGIAAADHLRRGVRIHTGRLEPGHHGQRTHHKSSTVRLTICIMFFFKKFIRCMYVFSMLCMYVCMYECANHWTQVWALIDDIHHGRMAMASNVAFSLRSILRKKLPADFKVYLLVTAHISTSSYHTYIHTYTSYIHTEILILHHIIRYYSTYMPRSMIHTYILNLSSIHTYIHKYINTYEHISILTCMHTYIHTWILMNIQAYLHAYIHTYIHTYIHEYLWTYKHTYMHACIHTYMNTYKHVCIHTCMHTWILMNI